jgi:hypothetical protein
VLTHFAPGLHWPAACDCPFRAEHGCSRALLDGRPSRAEQAPPPGPVAAPSRRSPRRPCCSREGVAPRPRRQRRRPPCADACKQICASPSYLKCISLHLAPAPAPAPALALALLRRCWPNSAPPGQGALGPHLMRHRHRNRSYHPPLPIGLATISLPPSRPLLPLRGRRFWLSQPILRTLFSHAISSPSAHFRCHARAQLRHH